MKLALILLLCFSCCFAQYRAVYDKKGGLTGSENLIEPPECGLMNFTGRITQIKSRNEGPLFFTVKAKRSVHDVELDLSPLANVDRSNLFQSFLKKGKAVSIAGYACGSNGIVDPISIKKA